LAAFRRFTAGAARTARYQTWSTAAPVTATTPTILRMMLATSPQRVLRVRDRGTQERDRVRRDAADPGRRDPRRSAGPAAERDRRLPRLDDTACDRAGTVDPIGRRRRGRRPPARTRHRARAEGRGAELGRPVRDRDGSTGPQDDARARRDAADPRPG